LGDISPYFNEDIKLTCTVICMMHKINNKRYEILVLTIVEKIQG